MISRLVQYRLVLLVLVLAVFDTLLVVVTQDNRSMPVDLYVARELQEKRPIDALVLPIMFAVSLPGYSPWAEMLVVFAVACGLLRRNWRMALLIGFTVCADISAALTKVVVARPRPTSELVTIHGLATGYSFPSGHVVHYVVFFGAIGYLAWDSAAARRGTVRRALYVVTACCVAVIGLVGMSRVYLGAHFPTDVLGGYVFGGIWLLALIAIDRRWLRSRWSQATEEGQGSAQVSARS